MTIRIAILCNDRIALPAVSWLISSGLAVAVAMPRIKTISNETQMLIEMQCANAGVPFRQFSKRSFGEDLDRWLKEYQPDLVLVKTFPWLIPAELLSRPAYGFVNFHYAPLPDFRGPAPLFWMIRNQVKEGGVTVHQMDAGFDTGPVLLQHRLPISPDLTYGWLVTQLAYAGLQLCWNLLQALATGTLQPVPQQGNNAGWFRRPHPSDLIVNWETMTAPSIRTLVLACNPWNKGAVTSWNNWMFGLTDVAITESNGDAHAHLPGTILSIDEQNGLIVSCVHHQQLRVHVFYCEEGFFPGHKLSLFGIKPGDRLGTYTMPAHSQTQPSSALHQST